MFKTQEYVFIKWSEFQLQQFSSLMQFIIAIFFKTSGQIFIITENVSISENYLQGATKANLTEVYGEERRSSSEDDFPGLIQFISFPRGFWYLIRREVVRWQPFIKGFLFIINENKLNFVQN